MLSIIISSINPNYLDTIKANIARTIGVEYEIILNQNNKIVGGLPKIYNSLATSSKYDLLLFVHDDMVFNTIDWGKKIVNILKDNKIGLVGLSGTRYKSKYPGTWSASDPNLYILSFDKKKYQNNDSVVVNEYTDAAVVDGCFMATRKELLLKYQFNESLKGFHLYDIDLCIRMILAKRKVVVVSGIEFNHYSNGKLNYDWVISTLMIHKKYNHILPICTNDISNNQQRLCDYLSLQCILKQLFLFKRYYFLAFKIYLKLITKYYDLNKLKYTKQILKYLFFCRPIIYSK